MIYPEETICSDLAHPLDPVLFCDDAPWTFKRGGGVIQLPYLGLIIQLPLYQIFKGLKLNPLKYFQKIEE